MLSAALIAVVPPWPKALRIALIIAVLGALPAPVATADAVEPCPNEQLRQESNLNPATGQPYSMQLPDCRAYELVSPADTGGWEAPAGANLVAGQGENALIAGESVLFESQATPAATGAVPDGFFLNVFRSHRTATGWRTRDLTPSARPGNNFLAMASSDGSRVLVVTTISLVAEDIDNPTENSSATGRDAYIISESAPPLLVTRGELQPVEEPLTESTASLRANSSLSAVAFVSVVSLERSARAESTAGCYIWRDAGPRLATLTNPREVGSQSARQCNLYGVTTDGRTVIEDTSGDAESGGLYAPLAGNTFPIRAVKLSGNTPGAARFAGIAPDGQTIYLTTPDKLTASSNEDAGAELYSVNLTEPGLSQEGAPTEPAVKCLSCDAAGSGVANAGSVSYVGRDADGSHVFFRLSDGSLYTHGPGGTVEIAGAGSGLEHIVISASGRCVAATTTVGLVSADSNSGSDVYLFCEGQPPHLVTDGQTDATYQPIAVSATGTRVIYTTEPADGTPSSVDEWADGTTTALSPEGSQASYSVLGIQGPELEDVFLEGHAPLVAQDENAGTTDIYDARINGGFPAPTQPVNNSQTPNPVGPPSLAYSQNLMAPTLQLLPLTRDTSRRPPPKAKAKPKTRNRRVAREHRKCTAPRARSRKTAKRSSGRRTLR